MESKRRSALKSITWPAVHIGFVGTMVYVFEKLLTGEAHWEYAGAFVIIYTAFEMIGFFLHERAWEKFGKRVK
jgi:uncharacterized membrane protein